MKHMSQSVQASTTCLEIRARDRVEFAAFRLVDEIEQPREGVAEIETAPARVTNIEHPAHFGVELRTRHKNPRSANPADAGSARRDCLLSSLLFQNTTAVMAGLVPAIHAGMLRSGRRMTGMLKPSRWRAG